MKLEGIVKVQQVDEDGNVTAETITISECVKIAEDSELALADPGTVVDASVKDEKGYYAIAGNPVSYYLRQALDMVSDISAKKRGGNG